MNLNTSIELFSELHCVIDANRNIIACNTIFAELLQKEKGDLMENNFLNYVLESNRKEIEQLFAKVSPDEIVPFHFSMEKADKTPVDISGKLYLEKDGYLHWVGSLQLKQNLPLAKFKQFFDMALLNIMIIIDRQGKPLLVNQEFSEVLGYTIEDLRYGTVFEMFEQKERHKIIRLAFDLIRKEGSIREQVVTCISKDQQIKWLSWKIVYNKGNFYAIANDITEIKEKENSIQDLLMVTNQRNQELEEARNIQENILEKLQKRNHELDQFVYRTSHDLRAPLSSILGLTNLAKIDIESKSDLVKYIDFIEQNILKLDEFVQALQDFTKSERTETKTDLIDFKKIIKNANSSLRFINGYDSLSINTEIEGSHSFYSDIFRIDTVLSNLISNAIKYQNFQMDNSFLNISVDLSKPDLCKIVVEDNGIGIKEEYLDRIFDMFFRATEKGQGSGLGLYIVKQVLDKIKGSIEIESKFGIGTKVTIHLTNLHP